MKERSKKKLATSTWVCHVEKCEMTKRADDQKVLGEIDARETEIAMGDCIKSDLERVGEEWKT